MNRHRHAMRLIADARPAALDDVPDRPAPSFPDEMTAARPAPRAGRRLLVAGLVPAVAAAVVGVAVVVSASHSPVPPPPTSEPTAPAMTAQGILLAAAGKTTTTPATGDYWVTKTELHHVYDVGGYQILGRVELERWHPLRPGGEFTTVARSLGAAPRTAADKAAWRAAGSPKKWDLPRPAGTTRTRTIPAGPGPRDVTVNPDGAFNVGGTPLTYAQIRALPTDPAQLRAHLLALDEAAGGHDGPRTRAKLDRVRVEVLFTQSWQLLTQLPVSPPTRAAIYRMLADVPGLTAQGSVEDAKGRAGVAIGFTFWVEHRTVDSRLIIDPESGAPLAREEKTGSEILLDTRFSDATPPRS